MASYLTPNDSRVRLEARIGPYSSGDAIVDDCRLLQGAPLASWPLGFSRFEALVRRYPAASMQATPPHLRWLREEWALKAALHARRKRAGRPSPLGGAGQLRFCAVGGGAPSDEDLRLLREAAGCGDVREAWGSYETLMIAHGVPRSTNHSYRMAVGSELGPLLLRWRRGPYARSARMTRVGASASCWLRHGP
mmetsp:Transcript_14883/g.49408  ORF Transcript_14883/g.49408 Transcript_14883/m.49408 type:complete len:193 (+) Transcript_14883:218-796(+)